MASPGFGQPEFHFRAITRTWALKALIWPALRFSGAGLARRADLGGPDPISRTGSGPNNLRGQDRGRNKTAPSLERPCSCEHSADQTPGKRHERPPFSTSQRDPTDLTPDTSSMSGRTCSNAPNPGPKLGELGPAFVRRGPHVVRLRPSTERVPRGVGQIRPASGRFGPRWSRFRPTRARSQRQFCHGEGGIARGSGRIRPAPKRSGF